METPSRWAAVVLCFSATLLMIPAPVASAQTQRQFPCSAMGVARITTAVDERVSTTLHGNVHPLARAEYDQGRVDDSLPLEHIILVLQRSPEQEKALTTRIDQMHNRRSPYYHQWLRAEDVGECYGVTDFDIAVVTEWLQSHGFKIDTVPAGKMLIIFSGTAGQVREAFHTEIHNLNVRGEQHIANMSEPQIPAALEPVVAGFRSLHNFFPKPLVHVVGPIQRDSKTGKWHALAVNKNAAQKEPQPNREGVSPLLTFNYDSETYWAVGPQDFYTIYNENPLLTASTPINGAGQTLAIVQASDVNEADITSFRSQFGLPAYPTPPNATQGGVNYMFGVNGYCSDPTVLGPTNPLGYVENEADVDLQWMGVTAPAAIIDFVACGTTGTTAGIDLSASYIVNNLASTVSAFSVSFGVCEAFLPIQENGVTLFGSNAFYNGLWEQAVAEGQTPVVATGDSGNDLCDRHDGLGPNGQDVGVTGLSVNGLASTPYNVAADGTDFTDMYQTNFDPTNYWNTNDTSPYLSALSYVPETVWNNSCANLLLVDYIRYASGGTKIFDPQELCNYYTAFTTLDGSNGGISTIYTLPTWQSVYGVGSYYTSSVYRNLPDVSLFASDGLLWGHMLVFCESDTGVPCDYSNGSDVAAMASGGTSFVAPMLGGIMGLINQAWPSGNPAQPTRQGQANYSFYALATQEYGTPSTANTSTTAPSLYTCESNSLAISTYGSVFPSCMFYDISRTPQYGTSTCVGATTDATCFKDSNDQPCLTGTTDCYTDLTLPDGTTYGLLSNSTTSWENDFPQAPGYSDATGLGSINVTNLVRNWTSVTPQFASSTTIAASPASIFTTTNTALTATVTATDRGGLAPPLGTVAFQSGASCTGTPLGTAILVPASGCTTSCNGTASLPAITGAQLGVGTQSVVACFSGDGANDAPSTSPAASVTVVQTALTLSAAPSSVSIVGGQTGTVALTVSANAAIPTPITLACSGLPTDASCTFSSITTLPADVTMRITTTTSDATLVRPARGSSLLMLALVLPGILLLPAGAGAIRRRENWLWCGLALLLIVSCVVGCGGNSTTTTSGKTYAVTVTASAANVTQAETSIQVTVTR